MRTKTLIQPLAGTDKIVIERVFEDAEANAIIIRARPIKREQCRCGVCHRKATGYDDGRGLRRWRCLDLGTKKCYIEAESHRVQCKTCGVSTVAVPWARHGSRFCRPFEELVAWLAVHASKTTVSQLMGIQWRTVGEICERIYREKEKSTPSRFHNLVNIGIDETSYKKGHKYMTVVIDHDKSTIIWCGIGHGKEVLSRFFEVLTNEQRSSIQCVSADGARWIASCVSEYCPHAQRCIDPFHVVSWATDALDKERRTAWSEAHQTAKLADKRGRGHPTKGKVVNSEQKQAKALKNLRYVLLKNPENLSERQQEQLKFLTQANTRLYRAYLLKEGLRLALKSGPVGIEEALTKWMGWAQRCRIPGFRELRLKIKRNFSGIVATAKLGLTNARMEAINNKIKLVVRTAFGFRNLDNLLAMVMLTCSNLRPNLPRG